MTSAEFSISHFRAIRLFYCMGSVKRLIKHLQESLIQQSDTNKIMKEGATMSKAGIKFEEAKKLLMKDAEFKAEYEKLKPRYDIISQVMEERAKQNITQEELAFRVGTQKSNISRLESGTYNPSLDFIIKVAHSLGKEMTITLK